MPNPVSVKKLEVKSHDSPDEVRSPDKTRVEVVKLEGSVEIAPGLGLADCIVDVVESGHDA